MSGKVGSTAPAGAVLTVFSQNGSWAKVQYNATVAYANTGFISQVTSSYPDKVSSGGSGASVNTEDGQPPAAVGFRVHKRAKFLPSLCPARK